MKLTSLKCPTGGDVNNIRTKRSYTSGFNLIMKVRLGQRVPSDSTGNYASELDKIN